MSDNKVQIMEADEDPLIPDEIRDEFEDDGKEDGELETSVELVFLDSDDDEDKKVIVKKVEDNEARAVEVVTIESDREEDSPEIQILEEHLKRRTKRLSKIRGLLSGVRRKFVKRESTNINQNETETRIRRNPNPFMNIPKISKISRNRQNQRRLFNFKRATLHRKAIKNDRIRKSAPKASASVQPVQPIKRRSNMVVNPDFQIVPSLPTNSYLRHNLNTNDADHLRPIIIDGSNVAMGHGNNRMFSCKGLAICAQFFLDRGHKVVKIVVPQFRKKHKESIDTDILEELDRKNLVTFSPSREYKDDNNLIVRIVPYDDRFILQIATELNGIVVSNDNYKDIHQEGPMFRDTIEKRVLQFAWVNDLIFFAQDPLGCRGPTLDQFLRF